MSLKPGFLLLPLLAASAACGGPSASNPPPLAYADVTVPSAPPMPPPPASGDADESPLFAPSVDPTPSATATAGPVASSTASGGSFFDVTPGASATAPPPAGGPPITAAIAALRPGFRQCYRDALAIDPSVKGDMNVEIVVKKDGSVGAMQATAKNIPKDLAECIKSVVKNGRFDGVATNSDTHVVIPIRLAKP